MRRGSWRFQWLAVAALVAAALAAIGVAQTAAGRSVLRSAGLAGSPPRYTELAFAAPMYLPEKLPPKRVPIHAPFWVHNVEGASRTYHWTFTERDGTGRTVLARGSLTLASGARRRLNPQLHVACRVSKRARLELRLDSPPRSIGWWADCLPPPTLARP